MHVEVEMPVSEEATASYKAGDYAMTFVDDIFNIPEPEITGDLSYIDIEGDLCYYELPPVNWKRPDERAEGFEPFKPPTEEAPYEPPHTDADRSAIYDKLREQYGRSHWPAGHVIPLYAENWTLPQCVADLEQELVTVPPTGYHSVTCEDVRLNEVPGVLVEIPLERETRECVARQRSFMNSKPGGSLHLTGMFNKKLLYNIIIKEMYNVYLIVLLYIYIYIYIVKVKLYIVLIYYQALLRNVTYNTHNLLIYIYMNNKLYCTIFSHYKLYKYIKYVLH